MNGVDTFVVAQTRTYRVFFLVMALTLAALCTLAVQRPLIAAYPAALLVLGVFMILGLHIFTSRLELEGSMLSAFRYGRRLWRIDVRQAQFRSNDDDIGMLVMEVFDQRRKIGVIRQVYFDPEAFKELWARIGEA